MSTSDIILGGRYHLLEPIGSGGEAQVFRARDAELSREVAIRLGLEPATFTVPDLMPSFHSGWVCLLDAGTDPERGEYQIFELLTGLTLAQIVATAPLATDPWRHFVDHSLQAVEALHAAGWIHGDLNADNFLKTHDSDWKLLELPFLRFDPPPGRSVMFGSIHTLSPEQLEGSPADVRSDLYALGSLYYYASCGTWPQSGNSREIAVERLRFAPAPLHEKAPGLPAGYSNWVMRLLERKPSARFDSAGAARQLLEASL